MNWKRKTMRGCSPSTSVSTGCRRWLTAFSEMARFRQKKTCTCATVRWRVCWKSAAGHWASIGATARCLTMYLVARSCTRGARSSRCWNGNIGVSARRGEADEDSIYLFFYALVQAAGIKTVCIKAGRLRAPATDCFLEVREFAVWKKNLFLDFGTKSSPARYQTVIPVCNPFLTVLVTVCFNPAWPLFTFHKETVPPLWPGYETERLFLTVAKKEKSKVFCMFRKKSYLYIKWVAHQRNWCKYVETRTVANSLPRFLMIRINFYS